MHIVFYNKKYANSTVATHSEGHHALLVLAVLFEVTNERNPQFDFTSKFSEIIQPLTSTTYDFGDIPFTALLPDDITDYLTFDGSLTTPPCSPITKWVVLNSVLPISLEQKELFATIKDLNHNIVTHNWRTPQVLDREIFVNKPNSIMKPPINDQGSVEAIIHSAFTHPVEASLLIPIELGNLIEEAIEAKV